MPPRYRPWRKAAASLVAPVTGALTPAEQKRLTQLLGKMLA
jgi:hypothetical protein